MSLSNYVVYINTKTCTKTTLACTKITATCTNETSTCTKTITDHSDDGVLLSYPMEILSRILNDFDNTSKTLLKITVDTHTHTGTDENLHVLVRKSTNLDSITW